MAQQQSLGVETHSFNVSLAKEVGLAEAIILQHFYYWHRANLDNPDMTKDGRVWFFRSVKSVCDDFCYLTPSKVKTAIEKLVSDGWVFKGNYNVDRMKRVTWYSLTDFTLSLFTGLTIGENRQCNSENLLTIGENRHKDSIIKDNNIHSTNDIEEKKEIDKSISQKTKKSSYDMSIVPDKCQSLVSEWLEHKEGRREKYTAKSFASFVKRFVMYVDKLGMDFMIERVQNAIANNYQGIFYKNDRNLLNGTQSSNNLPVGMIIHGDRNELYEADKKNLW